jgi:hypothetical protein
MNVYPSLLLFPARKIPGIEAINALCNNNAALVVTD